MIVAFSVAPTEVPNAQAEMSEAVAAAIKIVRESGLPNETNARFTLIEGEWDEVMSVVKRATEAVLAVRRGWGWCSRPIFAPGIPDSFAQR